MSQIEIELQRQLKQFWLKDIEDTFDAAFGAMRKGFAEGATKVKSAYATNDAVQSDAYNKKTLAVGIGGALLAVAAAVFAIPTGGGSVVGATSVGALCGLSSATVAGVGAVGGGVALVATTMPAMAPSARASAEIETTLGLLDDQLKKLKAKIFDGSGSSVLIENVFRAARANPKFAMATKRADTAQLRRAAIRQLFFPNFAGVADFSEAIAAYSANSFAALLNAFNAHLEVQSERARREIESIPVERVQADPRYPPIMVHDRKKEEAVRKKYLLPTAVASSFMGSVQLSRWLKNYNVLNAKGWGLGA